MIQAFDEGNLAEARKLQRLSINAICVMAESGSFFSTLRYLLELNGIEVGNPRSPIATLSKDAFKLVVKKITKLNIMSYFNNYQEESVNCI